MNLIDYLYVDLEKSISLYSQLTGGIVEVRERQLEQGQSLDNKRNYDFKVFKHAAGGTTQEKDIEKEVIKPHHALLQDLENELLQNGHLLRLNEMRHVGTLKDENLRDLLRSTLCVKCTGRAVIEDYDRLSLTSENWPDIVSMVSRSVNESLKESNQVLEIQAQIDDLKSQTDGSRTDKRVRQKRIDSLNSQIEKFIEENSSTYHIEPWILESLRTWISVFLPGIINIRLHPFEDREQEQLFGHLNPNNFSISNRDAFQFTYGSLPSEHLTMIGIVTSVPTAKEDNFHPLQEFDEINPNDRYADNKSFESAIRGVFRGFDGFEEFIRTCRYPRVMVLPLMIYRSCYGNENLIPSQLQTT